MPATTALQGMNPAAGMSGAFGDSATGGDAGGGSFGDRVGSTVVFGNQSTGSNTMLYIAAALAALWIFKGKK